MANAYHRMDMVCSLCGPITAAHDHNKVHACTCEEEESLFFLLMYSSGHWVMCHRCGAYWPLPMSFIFVDVNT